MTSKPSTAARIPADSYRLLTEQLPAITYIVELLPRPHTIFISPQVQSILGFSPEEWVADPDFWITRIHPDDHDAVMDKMRRHNQTGDPFFLEYRVLARDDRTVWVRNNASLQRDSAGVPAIVLGVMFDITERKQAEQQIEITKQSYRDLLDSLTESIYVQAADGTFIDVNQGAERMYRCDREWLIGKNPADVAAPGRNDLEAIRRMSADVMQTGEPARFRFWAVRRDGDVFPKDVVINKGRYFGEDVSIATARDITDQVQAEIAEKNLREQLAQSQKLESVGRLAGGVAHDYNNMLQTILGNAEIALEETPAAGTARECLLEILKAAQRSAHLTRQLMAFARKQTFTPRRLHLNESVTATLQMLQRLIGDGIQIAWHPDPHAGYVLMDPVQLDQILVNLAANARDAMSGQGVLAIGTGILHHDSIPAQHRRAGQGDFAVLTVRDNGEGMDPETLAHIFEPFYTTKDVAKGTGLGLATVYGIVTQNNGFITVDSTPGQGSTFEIHLPRLAKGEPEEKPAVQAPPIGGKETVLLVEDDLAILHLAQRMLGRLGYTLLTASHPEEALQIARAHKEPIHLLATDVVMPGMHGPEMARHIRDLHPDIIEIYLSGHAADAMAPSGLLPSGVEFIQKPFSISELTSRIRMLLDRK